VESTEGKGSSFTVSLPLFPVGGKQNLTDEEVEAQLPEQPSDKSLRILLIDDDKIQLNLTSAMLENKGIAAVCCEQLEELTEYLRREKFDFLLTDVQMPAINGFDLLTLLRASNIEQARTIPIIAVTARSEINEEEFLKHGFAGCLKKPFSASDLVAVISVIPLDDTSLRGLTRSNPDGETPQSSRLDCHGSKLPRNDGSARCHDFSALTAFSEGDEGAAQSIIDSFIVETTKNLDIFQSAYTTKDVETMTAMAHKLIPIFTLLHVDEVVSLLVWIESQWDKTFSESIKADVEHLIKTIRDIIEEARALRGEIDI